MYIALKNVTHSKTGKLVKKGKTVNLSHLDEESIAMLVSLGVVKKIKKEGKK